MGLEGDFSAKTFMWVQALFEVVKRLGSIAISLTAISDRPWFIRTDGACKFTSFVSFLFLVIPDGMAVLVSIDRIIAVWIRTSVWYKRNCTQAVAWYPIAGLLILFCLVGLPKLLYGKIINNDCTTDRMGWLAEHAMFQVGVPCVVVVAVLTSILVAQLKQRTANSRNPNSDNAVSIALTINCALYTVFAVIHYTLISLYGWVPKFNHKMVLVLSHIPASVGVTVRAFGYLALPTMRKAFKRSLPKIVG
ncbi:uncharacterized protein LOC134846465 isoform X2 [Symsagittifera roscoffensis]